MTIVSGIIVYVILWWLAFFIVLPFGLRVPDETEKGFATSAPAKPRLWLKSLFATLFATLFWGVVWWLIHSDYLSFRAV